LYAKIVAVITRFNLNSTTVDKQRPWFPYAMQSAIVMHATLALSAEFLAVSMPFLDRALQKEGFRQKGEVIRMVRPRLGAISLTHCDDLSVFAGVAMLASIEVSYSGLNSQWIR
jgi:hypothetical protein